MRNIKLIIEYDGTNYSGWQVQHRHNLKKKTIQEVLQRALRRVLQEKIKVAASGRTDAGVHARAQVAHFKTRSQLSCTAVQRALNSSLPRDIRIKQVKPVALDFHARFSAISKTYRYMIVNDSFVSVFLVPYAHLVKQPLDERKMRRGSRYLLGKHNFRSFQAVDKKEAQAIRTIKRLDVRRAGNLITLDIEANGFLYKMVRNIAGTLIEVGRGRLKAQDIREILKAKNRISAGPCAPAKGLSLLQVKYKRG
jgi:tRNA pseudouridine38-40 synthase